ncbi:hypothetical protein [Deminuibacter soli]|uniref:Uncharacterized protein n=1 Tax=Deminuibacter soli TaxID=2291815 RepID=A0A3E1NGA3_9BACT|nr:hypothetical protein [Deminuibacter soli]RFM26996.1 hypothetical protein DXN05_16065 [Deminuibacter soli]
MLDQIESPPTPTFSESEWLKLIFTLNDIQDWLTGLTTNAFMGIPVFDKKKLFRKTYYITITRLVHLLERHYYKIPRYPLASKFTVPVVDILSHLRDASSQPVSPVLGTLNYRRVINTGAIIGFDIDRTPTSFITVITDGGGQIITAYPGYSRPERKPNNE